MAARVRPASAGSDVSLDPINVSWISNTLSNLATQRKFNSCSRWRPASPTSDHMMQAAPPPLADEEDTEEVPPPAEPAVPASPEHEELPPDVGEVIKLIAGGFEGLTPADFERMRVIFARFKEPGSADMHKDEIPTVLTLLGYMFTEGEQVRELADKASTYSTIDFHEFTEFMEKFLELEQQKFRETFTTFDEDASGALDTQELMKVMSHMGFTPLRKMVNEALDVVDRDGSGTISFEEFLHLLIVYRFSEGFTRAEVKEFHKAFLQVSTKEKPDDERKVAVDDVKELMLKFFGPQAHALADKIGQEAITGSRKRENGAPVEAQEPMNYSEVLICARRLREMEFTEWKGSFSAVDEDGSGVLDIDEIRQLVEQLGYTLTRKEVEAVCAEVEEMCAGQGGEDEGGQLDFDEFVTLMQIFKVRDGFSKEDLLEFREAFDKFDSDGSGEVETIELSAIMRHLGFRPTIDDMERLLRQVDFNGSGSLDWRELLRYLRLSREEQLVRWKDVFNEYCEEGTIKLDKRHMPAAIKRAQQELEDDNEEDFEEEATEFVEFDEFLEVVEASRKARVAEQRKFAGFQEKDVAEYQVMFNNYDSDKSGHIEAKEIGLLMVELGFSMNSAADRDEVLGKIDEAKQQALDIGVTDVGEGAEISVWVLLQLLRILLTAQEKLRLEREAEALASTNFTTNEATEFKMIFASCLKNERVYEQESQGMVMGDEDDGDKGGKKIISTDGIRRMLGTLGLKVSGPAGGELQDKMEEYKGNVDYADFLRLMRWMMDRNFANINGTG
eukprot:TRINITY_DN17504_c0_g1_i1.p1 TRINITY_DN17504_c0_g1~~TRINITY_DN17504_c0_g1_i1.p1  ORF type:complete len:786 (-),score=234.68 TRINITY_DN17504_c0_g1_i1:359-2716(-)